MKKMEKFINEFIVATKNDVNHKRNCYKFLAYINVIGKADDPSSITKTDLEESIRYNEQTIKAENTMNFLFGINKGIVRVPK